MGSITLLTLDIEKTAVLTSNQRLHYKERARKVKKLRDLAKESYTGGKVADVRSPVKLTCCVSQDTRRRFDPPNFYPTIKALVDGLTDAGAWLDDDLRHIPVMEFTGAYSAPKGHTSFTVEAVPLH